MKSFCKLSTIALMASVSLASLAAEPLTGVAGYDPAQTSSIGFSASSVKGDAYSVTVTGQVGVTLDTELKGIKPLKTATDVPTKKKAYVYGLPDGTMVYAMGLGSDWGEMSEELAAIDIAKAKASGTISKGAVTLQFQKGPERCRTVNWVAVLPDGQRAWGGHPEGGWNAKNVNGSPRTAWCFKGDEVVQMDQATKTALAGKK